jgi:hypothetical protein
MTERKKLPNGRDLDRGGPSRKFKIMRPAEPCPHCNKDIPVPPLEMWVRINVYPDTGLPAEIFIKTDREETLAGALDAAAIAASMAWQNGVPFEAVVGKWLGMRFEPSGVTGDPAFPLVSSPLDYIAKWALKKFGKKETT